MNTANNKQVVQAFMSLFGRSAIADALDMMTDDATWNVVGKPHLYEGAGTKTKAQMARIWHELYERLEGGLQMRVTGMVAENELVAAEVRSDATTKTGKRYKNDYHFLITVRYGQIAAVKEYTDLMHAAEVFS